MSTPEPIFTVEPPQGRAPQPKSRNYFAWLTALALLIWKFGMTSLSMLFMMWVYSNFYGWGFSVGIVLLIFVHEMGHVIAAKMLGMPVSAPLFIPFFGAAIVMKQNPRDAWTEALMAYGGPLAGGLGGWICFLAGEAWQWPLLIAVASITFVINLFNLIPVPPLDGGRICAAVSPWFWLVGLVLLGGAVFYFHAAGTLLIIVVLVVIMAVRRVREMFALRGTPEMQKYYQLSLGTRAFVAAFYLGLVAALLLGFWDANNHLQSIVMNQPGDSGN
jgi:Zn-dependent protease